MRKICFVKSVVFICIGFLSLTSCNMDERFKEMPEWQTAFSEEGVKDGCITIIDNSHDFTYIYNFKRDTTRYSPASTFKIFNSLVALETGIAPDLNCIIPWNKKPYWNKNWEKDMDMREAFRVSSLPYYQEIARRIGRSELKKFVDTCHYGNKEIGQKTDEFWIDNTLKISADEQVTLVKELYFDGLPFSKRSQRLVRELMLQEDSSKTNNYKLSYKTGTIDGPNHQYLCWIVGYLEVRSRKHAKENMYNPYFFAMNIDLPDTLDFDQLKSIRLKILKNIFRKMEVIK